MSADPAFCRHGYDLTQLADCPLCRASEALSENWTENWCRKCGVYGCEHIFPGPKRAKVGLCEGCGADRDESTYGCPKCVDRHKKRVGRVFGSRHTYRTIVADPPWPYVEGRPGWSWREGAPSGSSRSFDYAFLSLGQIADLPIADLAERDAHLYLWTTQRYLRDAYAIADRWGFSVSSVLVWCKESRGFNVGGTFQSTTEFVLFGRRGNLAAKQRVDREWFNWPRGEHSVKPEAFLDLVEETSPGPYLELFARRQRLGWDTWGNEALEHVEIA